MRWRTRSLVAVGLGLTWAAPAHACFLGGHITYNALVSKMSYGGRLALLPGDEIGMVFSGEVNIPFGGGKGVVSPTVGFCKQGSFSELIFGASGAWQIWKDASGNNTANLQSGLSYQSYDGGSDMIIPIGASYAMKKSDKMTIFGGAQILWDSYTFDDGFGGEISDSDMDPAIYGGVMLNQGSLIWQAGAGLKFGYDTDIAITLGVSTNSGAANAIRRFVSAIRK